MHQMEGIKMYDVVLMLVDGTEERKQVKKSPGFEDIKKWVNGYIQAVPHFNKFEGRRCTAYVNEEGKLYPNKFALNEKATELWLQLLGKGPFIYKPELFGHMVIIMKARK